MISACNLLNSGKCQEEICGAIFNAADQHGAKNPDKLVKFMQPIDGFKGLSEGCNKFAVSKFGPIANDTFNPMYTNYAVIVEMLTVDPKTGNTYVGQFHLDDAMHRAKLLCPSLFD